MSTYCIGDVHGCYDELIELLNKVKFDKSKDELIFTGDIIGRGPKPLKVVEFIMSLGDRAHTVLGNHDLNFIAIGDKITQAKKRDNLDSILNSPKFKEIHEWFCQQPLLYIHPKFPICVVHAGIDPQWNIQIAASCSKEVEEILKNKDLRNQFLKNMYGDEPKKWNPNFIGIERLRYITNVLTRIRFCNTNFELDFENKDNPKNARKYDLYPWFELRKNNPYSAYRKYFLVFGHWAALNGECSIEDTIALDTGCVWGNKLTLWHYETQKYYRVKSVGGIPMK